MTNITIQPAVSEQLTQLHSILVECSLWLKKKKINQWQPVYHKARFTQEVLRKNVFSVILNECEESHSLNVTSFKVIGTVTLLPQKPDYYPFGIWNNASPVWYICRLAIKRDYIHHNYGKETIKVIENIAKQQGITCLRLDITPDNLFLKNYYLSLGFVQKFSEISAQQSIYFEKELV